MKNHILIFILIAVSIATSIIVVTFRFIEADRLRGALSRDAINQRIHSVFSAINDFPGSAGKDLIFLRSLSSIKDVYDGDIVNWRDMQDDFQNFIDKNSAYRELHIFIDKLNCAVIIGKRISDGGNLGCVALRPPVADALEKIAMLNAGEIYISPLVSYLLNSDQKDPLPVILYGSKVATKDGAGGSIVAVIDANYFMEEARRLSRSDEAVFLLDSDGFYLANSDRAKEKLFGGKDNFYGDFPEAPKGVISDPSIKQFETKKKIFTLLRIYPTESNFAIYEGMGKIFSEDQKNKYFWTMVAVSKKASAVKLWGNTAYLTAVILILFTHILIAAVAYNTLKLKINPPAPIS